jgi:prepilin-type processing-associated H-X9-DG protein
VKCAANLKQIGNALMLYANGHRGKYPDDLAALLEEDITTAVFVCPSSNDEPATGATTQAVAANLTTPRHCSYIYLGKGLSQPIDANRIILLEPLENHQRAGMNALFGDGHVDWLKRPEAEALLAKLAISSPATRQAGPATKTTGNEKRE